MRKFKNLWAILFFVSLIVPYLILGGTVIAANPPPQSSSIGLEGTISSAPPSTAPKIVIPANGSVFTNIPITISGICTSNLLVKIFDNNIFVGSAICSSSQFSLQIDLFEGKNDLVARQYDALDQASPDSATVSVTFNSGQFSSASNQLSLTSVYAERGAAPGTTLYWPIILSGGVAPYAISVDWGDGTPPDLLSQQQTGEIDISHIYKQAGVYKVTIKATDKNKNSAYLQVVGQATGAIQNNQSANNQVIKKEIIWWPLIPLIILVFISFFLGRGQKAHSIKKEINEALKESKN